MLEPAFGGSCSSAPQPSRGVPRCGSSERDPVPVKYAKLGGQGEGRQKWPDGEPIVVLRPLNRAQTMALVNVAIKHESEEALKQAVGGGPCELLGFLTIKDGKLVAVDENDE